MGMGERPSRMPMGRNWNDGGRLDQGLGQQAQLQHCEQYDLHHLVHRVSPFPSPWPDT